MIADPKLTYMTPEEYLDWEEEQPLKYGYIDGEIYDMTGGTIPHNDIAVNLTTLFKTYLRGKGCKVSMSDAKVGASKKGPFHYPDVMVTCDLRDQKARKVIYYPCLIVEVLSPSTEAFDRGDKFKHYRQISTLKEYVIISADKMSLDCYRLNEKNKWELTSYSLDEMNLSPEEIEIELTSINYSCPLSSIYEEVALSEEDN